VPGAGYAMRVPRPGGAGRRYWLTRGTLMSTETKIVPIPAGDWPGHVRREVDRFASVAAHSPLPVHVPAYPDFTVETLTAHIGRALRTFVPVLSPDAGAAAEPEQAPDGPAVIDWVRAGVDPILSVLAEVPADRLVPFPHGGGSRPAGLIAPLLAVEIGVHRWDVETVLGEHAEIPAELAIRSIDSVFENFVPRLAASGVDPIGGTLSLNPTDADIAWDISVDGDRLVARRSDDPERAADTTVSGTAEQLALLVWKRRPPAALPLQVLGRTEVLKRFLAADYLPDPRSTPAH
jgi:uncharacterized protein (TIGR03083 family)